MGRGFIVGGQKSRIYVVIRCKNALRSCPLEYSIDLACVNNATTSTPKPTSVSTAKPVQPSIVVGTCECHCCKGNATCVPVYVGTIPYYTNTCQALDCASRCSTQFSVCPVDGIQSGKIETYCRKNAGAAIRNVPYIPLLTFLMYISNII
ncbi:unnamed protein product [Rotaria sordida]|uniref:Uncharacterized protein n=1 Tax=Rotaria sordida TaxID=392033 RepID=A0A814MNF4_9BILA|nr:unnamed protein product [Rotaria sordida]CAF1245194.1 unnamed protein product [Rotaria sordida]CAF1277851.1 unnamed protein product [Rotaria sordida]CAF3991377.1 unnamed protein product [Rotaria sordida]CAF4031573.1 unnamed protein product [Rotaria sordida]